MKREKIKHKIFVYTNWGFRMKQFPRVTDTRFFNILLTFSCSLHVVAPRDFQQAHNAHSVLTGNIDFNRTSTLFYEHKTLICLLHKPKIELFWPSVFSCLMMNLMSKNYHLIVNKFQQLILYISGYIIFPLQTNLH